MSGNGQIEIPGGRYVLRGSRPPFLARLRSEEKGVAAVELALALPLLLVLILGMIDFGKAINYWIDETHVANEGARLAIVNNNPGAGSGWTLQEYIRRQVETTELRGEHPGTQQTQHSATVNICFYKATDGTSTSTPGVGDIVKVTVAYTYDWSRFLLAQAGIGPTTTIAGTSAMRLEALPSKYSTADNTGGSCPASV
jgi:Flp pilus assembly protein TadG